MDRTTKQRLKNLEAKRTPQRLIITRVIAETGEVIRRWCSDDVTSVLKDKHDSIDQGEKPRYRGYLI